MSRAEQIKRKVVGTPIDADKESQVIQFDSIKEAAEAVGGKRAGISSVLTKRQHTAYGYVWTYLSEKEGQHE